MIVPFMLYVFFSTLTQFAKVPFTTSNFVVFLNEISYSKFVQNKKRDVKMHF